MPASSWTSRTETGAVAVEAVNNGIFMLLPQKVCIFVAERAWVDAREGEIGQGVPAFRLAIRANCLEQNEFFAARTTAGARDSALCSSERRVISRMAVLQP
jgi:hypothetical protein